MPGMFLMTMKLSKQGEITGSSTHKDGGSNFEKGMMCHAFNYAVKSQFDASSGQATGRRTHTPISIVKEVDNASPLLWSALCSNEAFTTATLSFAKPSTGVSSFTPRKIELRNGAITGIRHGGIRNGKKCEELTLKYEDILIDGRPGAMIHPSLLG